MPRRERSGRPHAAAPDAFRVTRASQMPAQKPQGQHKAGLINRSLTNRARARAELTPAPWTFVILAVGKGSITMLHANPAAAVAPRRPVKRLIATIVVVALCFCA